MNAQKEAMKDGLKKITLPNLSGKRGEERSSATADAGFTVLEKVVSWISHIALYHLYSNFILSVQRKKNLWVLMIFSTSVDIIKRM